jgi:thiol-disulfide isomerase/thioredoxin
MRRHGLRLLGLVFWTVLPMPAVITWATPAGQEGVRWHHDLEAAKTLARQTDRLVLVHVWTPNCPPCENLDQNVLNQPSVAAATTAPAQTAIRRSEKRAAIMPLSSSLFG